MVNGERKGTCTYMTRVVKGPGYQNNVDFREVPGLSMKVYKQGVSGVGRLLGY